MDIPAFVSNPDNKMEAYRYEQYPCPRLWKQYKDITSLFCVEDAWSDYIKYLNERNEISAEIKALPNDYGGIYVFFIQGDNLPFCERYLAYIGRARYTDKENLRRRLMQYLRESNRKDGKRPLIKKLFFNWKEHLYIRYYKSKDNSIIDKGESALINAILPPFNTKLTDYKFKEPQKAF